MHFKKLSTMLAGAILSCAVSFAGASLAVPAAHAATLHANSAHTITGRPSNGSSGSSSAYGTGISYASGNTTLAISSGGASATGDNTLAYGNSQGQSSSGNNGLGSGYYSGWFAQSTHN